MPFDQSHHRKRPRGSVNPMTRRKRPSATAQLSSSSSSTVVEAIQISAAAAVSSSSISQECSPLQESAVEQESRTSSSTSSGDDEKAPDESVEALGDSAKPTGAIMASSTSATDKTRMSRRNRRGRNRKRNGVPLPTPVMHSHSSENTRRALDSTDDVDVKGSESSDSPESIQNSLRPVEKRVLTSKDSASSISTAQRPVQGPKTLSSSVENEELKQPRQRQGQMQVSHSPSGPSGPNYWVRQVLAAHYSSVQSLGFHLANFPNARLSLNQLNQMLKPVMALCNLMKPEQFGIQPPAPQLARQMSGVHYWKLWESDTIDMGIFFMPPNAVIPLHNHPGMSVVTRILYGCATVTSYDLIASQDGAPDSNAEVDEETPDQPQNIKWARVSRKGDYVGESTMWLDPRRFNLHHIQATSPIGCALLDIMIPPYDNADRDCHHFQILEEQYNKAKEERIVKLLESITVDHRNGASEDSTSDLVPSSSSPPASSVSSSSR